MHAVSQYIHRVCVCAARVCMCARVLLVIVLRCERESRCCFMLRASSSVVVSVWMNECVCVCVCVQIHMFPVPSVGCYCGDSIQQMPPIDTQYTTCLSLSLPQHQKFGFCACMRGAYTHATARHQYCLYTLWTQCVVYDTDKHRVQCCSCVPLLCCHHEHFGSSNILYMLCVRCLMPDSLINWRVKTSKNFFVARIESNRITNVSVLYSSTVDAKSGHSGHTLDVLSRR